MSSVYCPKCHNMIWDKYTGFEKGCGEYKQGEKIFSFCICGHKEDIT